MTILITLSTFVTPSFMPLQFIKIKSKRYEQIFLKFGDSLYISQFGTNKAVNALCLICPYFGLTGIPVLDDS